MHTVVKQEVNRQQSLHAYQISASFVDKHLANHIQTNTKHILQVSD
jgi:hypothetical protein